MLKGPEKLEEKKKKYHKSLFGVSSKREDMENKRKKNNSWVFLIKHSLISCMEIHKSVQL